LNFRFQKLEFCLGIVKGRLFWFSLNWKIASVS